MSCAHPSHPGAGHGLTLRNHRAKFTCDGCKMGGYGDRYACDTCDFKLHKECMFPKTTASPEPFNGYTFSFRHVAPRWYFWSDGRCDVCGTTVEGFGYHYKRRGLDVHPLCALLKKEVGVYDVVFRLTDKVVVDKCLLCEKGKNVRGCCYVSNCGGYGFHVYCLMELGMEGCRASAGEGSGALAKRSSELHVEHKGRRMLVKIVKLFLQILLSVLFGDPMGLLATVVEQLLTN